MQLRSIVLRSRLTTRASLGLALAGSLLLGLARTAAAQDPTSGFDDFPEFRNLSGLSGCGYGLTNGGFLSLSGPTAFSTPVGPVLGHSQAWFGGGLTSFNSSPADKSRNSNSTGFGTYGMTFGRMNIAFTDMVISWPHRRYAPDQAFNMQVQPIPDRDSRVAWAAAIQDLGGAGASAGAGVPGDTRTSRSLFGVATYRISTGTGISPVFLSGGIGTRRYKGGFGSASFQAIKPVRLWIEEDGFGFNEGVLGTWNVTEGRRPLEVTSMLGLQKGRYFTWSFGIGF